MRTISTKSPLLVLTLLPLAAACGKKPTPESTGSGSTAATAPAPGAAPAPAPAPAARPYTPDAIKLTSCNLGPTSPVGDNGIAAARGLLQAKDGTLYYFADSTPPQRLNKVDTGCGYALAALTGDGNWGVGADGTIALVPDTDESPAAKCRTSAYSDLRYGGSTLVGGKVYSRDDSTLMVSDLGAASCDKVEAKLPDLPGGRPDISGSPTALFIVGHGDDLYDLDIAQYDPSGKVVQRHGSKAGQPKIERAELVSTCGPGFCASESESFLDVYGADGKQIKSYNLYDLVDKDRKGLELQGLTEVPGKGVYILVGYSKDKGHAELYRVDGL